MKNETSSWIRKTFKNAVAKKHVGNTLTTSICEMTPMFGYSFANVPDQGLVDHI